MQLGVEYVIHGNLIRGVNPDLVYDDMVIIDDFIDMKPDYPTSILPYFYRENPKGTVASGRARACFRRSARSCAGPCRIKPSVFIMPKPSMADASAQQ